MLKYINMYYVCDNNVRTTFKFQYNIWNWGRDFFE